MATIDAALRAWRQIKRVISVGLLGVGGYLGWQLSTGDLGGPAIVIIAAVLSGIGVVGTLFPSKVRVLSSRSGPD